MEQHMDRDERRAGAWTGGLILLILLASVASFLVATRAWWLQPLASVQGVAIDEMFTAILVVTAIAFVAVHLFLALALFRYGAAAASGPRPGTSTWAPSSPGPSSPPSASSSSASSARWSGPTSTARRPAPPSRSR